MVAASARRIAAAAASGASLGEAQLRESGLRLPPEGARLLVRPLGGGELALQPEELPLAVASEAGGRILRLHEPLPRAACLVQRVPPRSVELQDLGAVHEAATRERNHLGLECPPVRRALASTRAHGVPRTPPGRRG